MSEFIQPKFEKPIICECFVDGKDDISSLDMCANIVRDSPSLKGVVSSFTPDSVKGVLRKLF